MNELYASFGTAPSASRFDFRGGSALSAQQTIDIATTQAGTYYILVKNQSVDGYNASTNPNATAQFSLTATVLDFSVTAVAPAQVGNAGNATVEIQGAKFDRATTFQLIDSQNNVSQATAVDVVDGSTAYVTFNLSGMATGAYSVQATQADSTTTQLAGGLSVVAGQGPNLQAATSGNTFVRLDRENVFQVSYGNSGDADMPAPLVFVTSDFDNPMSLTANKEYSPYNNLMFVGVAQVGPAGVLRPGTHYTVPVYWISGSTSDPFGFQVSAITAADMDPIALSDVEQWVQTSYYTLTNWSAIATQLMAQVGPTWGDFVKAMAHDATLIPSQLGDANNLTDLVDLEVQKAIAAVGTSISGQLQAADLNVPLAGLNVYAQDATTGQTYYAVSLNDGSFVFNQMTAGTYEISVHGYQLASDVAVTVSDGQAVTGVNATIASAPGISGQVLAQGTNQPVIAAYVQAFGATGTLFDGYTDANGSFDIAGLPPDTYALEIDATGLARSVVENLTVTATTGPTPQAISMAPEGVIAGTLTLPSGGPTGGTLTVAADLEGSTDLSQQYTAQFPGGTSFSLGGLPAGTYDLTIALDGYLPQTVKGIAVTSGNTADPGPIDMVAAATVSGTFTSNDAAAPAAGTLMGAFDATGALVDATTADASGNFTITNLPAGTYTIEPVGSLDAVTPATVAVVAGDNATGVNVSAQVGGTIVGTVTDSQSGVPLTGVPVYARAPDGSELFTVTDASGLYTFAHLGLGTYAVSLDESAGGAASYQMVSIAKLDGTQVTANLQLATSVTLSGSVTEGGNPVSGAIVDLYQSGKLVASSQTGADGSYSYLLFSAGTYDVVASAPGMSFAAATGVVVALGSPVQENFSAGTASLQVTVTDSTSVTGAAVDLEQITADGTVNVGSLVVGADGIAQFSHLAAGSYTAVVTNANDRGASGATSLSDGQSGQLSIALASEAAVSGSVTDETTSLPVADAQLVLFVTSDPTQLYFATSGSDGSYTINNVPLGTYSLSVGADGYAPYLQTNVAVTGDLSLPVQLVPSQADISGQLDDWQGNPVAGALVEVLDASGNVVGQAVTASGGGVFAAGSFDIAGPSGGGLTLRFTARGVVYDDSNPVDVPTNTQVSVGTLDLPPLAGQGLGGVIITSSSTTPPVAQQAWLAILPASFKLSAKYKPEIDLTPCTDANGNEPCKSERIEVQDAASEYLESEAELESGYTIDEAAAQQLRQEFLTATTAFVGLIVNYDKIELQMALVEQQISGNSTLYRDTAANLNATVSELANAVRAVEAAPSSTALDAAFAALDAVRADVIAREQALAAEWQNLGLTILQPVSEKTLLAAFQAAAQKFNIDPYAQLRLDIVADHADDFEFKMKAESGATQEHYDKLIEAVEKYLKCLSDHQGFNDGDGDADDTSCIPGPDNDHDNKPKPPPPKKPTTPPPSGLKWYWPLLPYLYPGYPKGSFDPNDIVGPQGYGDQHFVPANQPLDYTIDFQNESTATAPAQEVIITDKLDPNVDPRSFRLGDFGWDGQRFSPPANSAFYQTTIDETATLGIDVQVTATIDVLTDTATWIFQTIDPATGEAPIDPSKGFLPPDDAFGAGEGFVSYSVLPNSTVQTGDVIDAQATVVFDTNPPIDTKQIFNTIDTGVSLASQVTLPAHEGNPQFLVSWAPATASNGSSGVATYDVYVSDDGGEFTPFVSDTTATSATFNGQKGHTYQFYSVASDNAGNVQSLASIVTVTTTVGDVVEIRWLSVSRRPKAPPLPGRPSRRLRAAIRAASSATSAPPSFGAMDVDHTGGHRRHGSHGLHRDRFAHLRRRRFRRAVVGGDHRPEQQPNDHQRPDRRGRCAPLRPRLPRALPPRKAPRSAARWPPLLTATLPLRTPITPQPSIGATSPP